MVAMKDNPKRDVNGWVRTNVHATPANNLVTVDHWVRGNGAWRPKLARTGTTIFFAVTTALVAWVMGAQLGVHAHKRRAYHEEVNQRLREVTKVCALHLKPASTKTLSMRMAVRGQANSRPRKVHRINGR